MTFSFTELVTDFNNGMDAAYKTKHLGEPQFMIGIKVDLTPTALHLSQTAYIRDVARRFKQLESPPAPTPANATGCLATHAKSDDALLDTSTYPYMALIGSILWSTITRPDVSTAVSRACQRSRSPTMADWRAAMRILRYLLATADLGLTYRRSTRQLSVSAYVDAGFSNELKQRSRYGFAVYLAGSLVMWGTKSTTIRGGATSK